MFSMPVLSTALVTERVPVLVRNSPPALVAVSDATLVFNGVTFEPTVEDSAIVSALPEIVPAPEIAPGLTVVPAVRETGLPLPLTGPSSVMPLPAASVTPVPLTPDADTV